MRIVLDTNVINSALLIRHSKAFDAYQKILAAHQILSFLETEIELITTIKKKKLQKYFKSEGVRGELLYSFLSSCKLMVVSHRVTVCRDPDDNKFLELALSGEADLIISGDDDLLALNPFQNIQILNVNQFLTL